MLIGFRQASVSQVREKHSAYGEPDKDYGRTFFDHEKLSVYQKALAFVTWGHELRKDASSPFSTDICLDRTSTGLTLNIAEGNAKFSPKDRCRFITHARTAALQAAAHIDVLAARDLLQKQTILEGKALLEESVRMLVAWQKSTLAREVNAV